MDPQPESSDANSAALKRIHRLEFQERDRIARELVTADSRRERLKRIKHVVRFPMAALGLAWAVCGIVVLTTHSTGTTSPSSTADSTA